MTSANRPHPVQHIRFREDHARAGVVLKYHIRMRRHPTHRSLLDEAPSAQAEGASSRDPVAQASRERSTTQEPSSPAATHAPSVRKATPAESGAVSLGRIAFCAADSGR